MGRIDLLVNKICLNQRYMLLDKIGSGSFGDVFRAKDINTNKIVAVKVEKNTKTDKRLKIEKKIYQVMRGVTGIPEMRWFGQIAFNAKSEEKYDALVLDYVGPSLEDVVQKYKVLKLAITLHIAEQMLTVLETLHTMDYIHRDIKPDNILLSCPPNSKKFRTYLVDFGLGVKFRKGRNHIPFRTDRHLTGTARFASLNSHRGLELSRRDDLESLGYVLIYLLKGRLPWQGKGGSTREIRHQRILKVMEDTSLEELCQGFPPEILQYTQTCRELKFDDLPDYNYLRHLLRSRSRMTDRKVLQLDLATIPLCVDRHQRKSTEGIHE